MTDKDEKVVLPSKDGEIVMPEERDAAPLPAATKSGRQLRAGETEEDVRGRTGTKGNEEDGFRDLDEPGTDVVQDFKPSYGREDPSGFGVDPNPVPPKNAGGAEKSAPFPEKTGEQEFLEARKPVGFSVSGGTYTVPCIDIRASEHGVVVFMPYGGSEASFRPEIGASLTVRDGNRSYDCFYPGICMVYEELGCMVVVFVRADEESA